MLSRWRGYFVIVKRVSAINNFAFSRYSTENVWLWWHFINFMFTRKSLRFSQIFQSCHNRIFRRPFILLIAKWMRKKKSSKCQNHKINGGCNFFESEKKKFYVSVIVGYLKKKNSASIVRHWLYIQINCEEFQKALN